MSTIDWTMAQALEGGTVEAQVYALRAKLETGLVAEQDRLGAQYSALEQLHEAAKATPVKPQSIQVTLGDLWTTAKIEFASRSEMLLRAEQSCKAFALRHGLARAPYRAEATESVLHIGLFVVLETLLNAGFLNNAYMVAGPTQAIFAAALISLTNVAASTAGGYFIGRWLAYGLHTAEPDDPAFKPKRDAARIGLIVFVAVMGLFHLTVGLIRAQETLTNIEHSPARYLEILTTPDALFLVMFGIVLSAVSWEKGLTAFGDPCPGFSERQRGVDQALDDLECVFEDLSERVEARFDDKHDELENAEKSSRKARKTYNRALETYRKAARKQDCAIDQAESRLRAQIAQIVQHHRAARGYQSAEKLEIPRDHLTSFQQYRAQNPPEFLPVPDYSAQKAKLAEAKAKALESLTALFERAFTHDRGVRA